MLRLWTACTPEHTTSSTTRHKCKFNMTVQSLHSGFHCLTLASTSVVGYVSSIPSVFGGNKKRFTCVTMSAFANVRKNNRNRRFCCKLNGAGRKITSSCIQKIVSSSFETKLHCDSLLHARFAFQTLTREGHSAGIIERSIMLLLCY